jgi:hypothetical protein
MRVSVMRGRAGGLVVVSGIRAAAPLDSSDDETLVVLPERHGEPELTDTDFLVRAVLEGLTVVWWIAPRGIDDLIELLENPVLFLGGECIQVVLCPRRGFPRPRIVSHRPCRTARAPPPDSSLSRRGCPPQQQGGR